MSDARRTAGLVIAVLGLGTAIFGVVRGVSATGPARGIRMTVAIEPPVDTSALAMAQHTVAERIEEKGVTTRVMPAGDKLVVELGDTDGDVAAQTAAIIERTGKLDILDATTQQPVIVARSIRDAEVSRGGVAIELGSHAINPNDSLAFVFDGKPRGTFKVDAVTATNVHVDTGLTEEGIKTAFELVSMIHAGAAHPMHVTKQEAFSRTTGFLPRAWLFLAIGAALIAVGGFLGLTRRR